MADPVFGTPGGGKVSRSKPYAFVLMPFRNDLQAVFSEHVTPVCRRCDLDVFRGDDFFSSNQIMNEVWNAIYYSSLIIADCTGKNANVFYELGIAHTLGKPALLLSQSLDDVPFDLRHWRCLIYDSSVSGLERLDTELAAAIEGEKPEFLLHHRMFLAPLSTLGWLERLREL
ncbi:MAG: hypothetical protein IT428_15725 [Planctomycetaceae bacterium]|nr:hypothetical protein [Planctomycetaceae bacterium]